MTHTKINIAASSKQQPITKRIANLGTICFLAATIHGAAQADVYATYKSGNTEITLLTDKCPGDSTRTLKMAVSKTGGKLRVGCYTINKRNNPIIVWEDGGTIQELNGNLFTQNNSDSLVIQEINPNTQQPQQRTKKQQLSKQFSQQFESTLDNVIIALEFNNTGTALVIKNNSSGPVSFTPSDITITTTKGATPVCTIHHISLGGLGAPLSGATVDKQHTEGFMLSGCEPLSNSLIVPDKIKSIIVGDYRVHPKPAQRTNTKTATGSNNESAPVFTTPIISCSHIQNPKDQNINNSLSAQPQNSQPDDSSETHAIIEQGQLCNFPTRAWSYGHQGKVTVRVQVLPDGSITPPKILQSSGSGILDKDAKEYISKASFRPARKGGKSVESWLDIPLEYKLQ